MANDRDRFDDEGRGGGSFVLGLLTGTVLGAGLGMLLSPKAGSALRQELSGQAGNLANRASDGFSKATETAGEWADRGRGVLGKAKDAMAKGAEKAQQHVRDTVSSVKDTTKG